MIIKRRLLPLSLVGILLVAALLTALLSSSMTGAEHRMQVPEFTPTAFKYLPLVTKGWPSPLVANLWLINNSGTDICEVYFSPPSEPWGKNRLVGGETIAPGGSALWMIPAGIYDLWARDCSQNTLSLLWYQSVSGNHYWVIPPGPEPSPTPPPPFSADLAITDLYPETLYGPIWVRITNHGPGIVNHTVQLSCQWEEYDPIEGIHHPGQMGPMPIPISNLAPNQTQSFNTDVSVNLHSYTYDMTCTIEVPFNDPNLGNNTYSESFP